MAIAIEGYTVVGLKSQVMEKYPGGLEALTKASPNGTFVADDNIWRCSFMTLADAERFVARLEHSGLEVGQGPNSDVAVVNEFDLSVAPYCEWVSVARWEKGVIAWLAGTTPRRVVAREGWSPERGSGLEFANSDDEHLELLRIENNVTVYFDKRRNCEVYVGRTHADADEMYKLASRVISEHFVSPGEPSLGGEAAKRVSDAVARLEQLAKEHSDAWRIHFFVGKGKLALGDLEGAYRSLAQANELETETEALPRELAGVCLALGRGEEAVAIGQKAACLRPDSYETLSNLAVAYLVAGRHAEASNTIQAALKLQPDDATSRTLERVIRVVVSGAQPQPRNLTELMQLAARVDRPTMWSRLVSWIHRHALVNH